MAWFKRLINLTRLDRLSRELDREMEFHLAERTDDLIAKGMSAAQARREARRRFGHVPRIKERTRDVEVHAHLEALIADVRYGARWLLKQPVFTTAAVLCLALGIGANTAIFSLLDAVVFESLPVRRP